MCSGAGTSNCYQCQKGYKDNAKVVTETKECVAIADCHMSCATCSIANTINMCYTCSPGFSNGQIEPKTEAGECSVCDVADCGDCFADFKICVACTGELKLSDDKTMCEKVDDGFPIAATIGIAVVVIAVLTIAGGLTACCICKKKKIDNITKGGIIP